jgi:hypothetical protein
VYQRLGTIDAHVHLSPPLAHSRDTSGTAPMQSPAAERMAISGGSRDAPGGHCIKGTL